MPGNSLLPSIPLVCPSRTKCPRSRFGSVSPMRLLRVFFILETQRQLPGPGRPHRCSAAMAKIIGEDQPQRKSVARVTTTDANGKHFKLKDLKGEKWSFSSSQRRHTAARKSCSFLTLFRFRGRIKVSYFPDKESTTRLRISTAPFTLLRHDISIGDAYGTYGQKKFMGRTYMAFTPTFLIDEKGKIKKIFEKVKPEDHASEVLEAFEVKSGGSPE